MVSKYGTLLGIKPQATGYHFELYPEGFLRHDTFRGKDAEFRPRASLNFKWDVTPQATFNATVHPDFAQIESDPFELNLTRYPTYFDERRPFFLEGAEIFRMSDFGENRGFFRPLDLFYSRRIGKSIGQDAVPILAGLKLTAKSRDWNVGMLAARADEYSEDNVMVEPQRTFGVLRAKHRVLANSDVGMLFSGTRVDEQDYNYALGLDGVYRRGINQLIVQGAFSDRSGKRGSAFSSGYLGLARGLLTTGVVEVVQDSFDVGDVGFVPWAGRKRFMISTGPYRTYAQGFVRELIIAPAVSVIQEPGSRDWSTLGSVLLNPTFRNNCTVSLEFSGGRYHEAGSSYFQRLATATFWGTSRVSSSTWGAPTVTGTITGEVFWRPVLERGAGSGTVSSPRYACL